MIHYQLQCPQGHAFDGWFKDSISFEAQSGARLVACPSCNSTDVSRALMAPSLGRGTKKFAATGTDEATRLASREATPPAPAPAHAPTTAAIAEAGLPDNVRALLQRLRAEVERSCDYVGTDFAEEARRIHYGETDARGIYGEATQSDAEALADEGIDIGVLPWLPRSDS
jgi:hypothetical protein